MLTEQEQGEMLRYLPSWQADRKSATEDLQAFIRWMEPQFPFSWHHKLLIDELHAWAMGYTRKLMIFMPPRYAKSLFSSRLLPAFVHGLDSNARIMASSYSSDLIEEHLRGTQNYMLSPEYMELFPKTALTPSAPTAAGKRPRLKGDMHDIAGARGYFKVAGRSGRFTGHGLTHGIIDDPFKNREEAESNTVREKVWAWYTSTFLTRRDIKDAALLLIMTRWHEDDLAGKLLKAAADQWRVISLPAIMEAQDLEHAHKHDLRDEGDALWPSQFDADDLAEIRAEVGEYDWNALYQQRPIPSGGARIPIASFEYLDEDELPTSNIRWVRFWDLAVSKKTTADFTVGALVGKQPRNRDIYLKDIIRGRWEWPQARRIILETAKTDRCATGIEVSGQQEGFFDDLKEHDIFASVPLLQVRPDRDKLTRALPWIACVEAGTFYLVRNAWNGPFVSESGVFTGIDDRHDDQIDAISGAYELHVSTYSGLTDLLLANKNALLGRGY